MQHRLVSTEKESRFPNTEPPKATTVYDTFGQLVDIDEFDLSSALRHPCRRHGQLVGDENPCLPMRHLRRYWI